MRPRSGRTKPRARDLLSLGAILAATFAAYLPSLGNGFTNWDDPMYVSENRLVSSPDFARTLTTPVGGNYHPLTIWSLALNYRVSGLAPASYHWLNLLLHLANTALVFVFVRRLSGGRLWTTAATSLFFGIHPMHVESVAWIAERKDVLYAFFFLLGLIAYLRHQEGRGRAWLHAALAAFVLSIASKPAAVVFPVVLLALDWFARRPFTRSVMLEKVPFFLISLVGGLLTLAAQKTVGAVAKAHEWGLWEKAQFAGYGTAMYVGKFLVPLGLSAFYPYPGDPTKLVGPQYPLALGAVVVAVLLAGAYRRTLRPVVFGLAFFFVNIALVIQLFTVGAAIMADRYTYLPYIGLLFATAWWLDEKPPSIAKPVQIAIAAWLILLIPACLVQTWRRCEVWRNSGTLWSDTIRRSPYPIADAYIHRAYYYHHEAGQPEKALADYDRALALTPGDAGVWCDRGLALFDLARDDSAAASLERSVALHPNIAQAQNNLGGVTLRRGDPAGALLRFARAIELNPGYRDAYANRALAYTSLGKYEPAIEDFRRAIELGPANPGNHALFDGVGVCLQRLNRYREAATAHDEAIRLAPSNAPQRGEYFLHRSLAWSALGDRAQAIRDADSAEEAGGKVPPAYLKSLGR